ncbi:hypothetical protein PG997_012217 [Apiospora hydei]|uniref:Uncharacterized protein n=1 Tax=Apiospora hydei TaxID=1337664 RepID=A0ABR1V2Q2_9PEZI
MSDHNPENIPNYRECIDAFLSTPGSKVAFIKGLSGTGKSTRLVPDLQARCYARKLPLLCLQPSYATAKSVCEAFNNRKDKSDRPGRMRAEEDVRNVNFALKESSMKHYVARDFCRDNQDMDLWTTSGCTEVVVVLDNMAPAQTYWDVLCFEQVRLWMERLRKGDSKISLSLVIMVSTPALPDEVVPYENFPGYVVMQWTTNWIPAHDTFHLSTPESTNRWTVKYHKIKEAYPSPQPGDLAQSIVCLTSDIASVDIGETINSQPDMSAYFMDSTCTSDNLKFHMATQSRKTRVVLFAENEMRSIDMPLSSCIAIICFADTFQWRQDDYSKRFMPMSTTAHMNDKRWAIHLAYKAYYTDNSMQPTVLVETLTKPDGRASPDPELRCCLLTMLFLAIDWWPGRDPTSIPILDRLYHPVVLGEMTGRLCILGALSGYRFAEDKTYALTEPRAVEAARLLEPWPKICPTWIIKWHGFWLPCNRRMT